MEAALRACCGRRASCGLRELASAYYWSHAGAHFETRRAGRWWAAVDEASIPDSRRDAVAADFEGDDGDRRQEIVFIGTGLDEMAKNRAIIVAALDACLLTEKEMQLYRLPGRRGRTRGGAKQHVGPHCLLVGRAVLARTRPLICAGREWGGLSCSRSASRRRGSRRYE